MVNKYILPLTESYKAKFENIEEKLMNLYHEKAIQAVRLT